MTNSVGAVLLDTRSIQKYVFSCNELKTNVGASYIVDRIFTKLMCEQVLPDLFYQENLDTDWAKNQEIKMRQNDKLQCEVVYVGGGNMLLLVRMSDMEQTQAKCKEIVKAWSKNILLSAPGLHTGAAIGTMDITKEGFKKSLDSLYVQLKQHQNNIVPNVDLPYTGLTKECDVSGKNADKWDNSTGKKRMVAAEVKAKIDAYEAANVELQDKYRELLQDQYCFASEFEKIGYREGESYLSVIHIDGNNMGVKFSACDDAQERKELSLKVQKNVETAFKALLQSIVAEYDSYKDYLNYGEMVKGNNKRVLPIRPIIIGGDDVTFVCPGRLGIEYAQRFMEAMAELPLLTKEQHEKMEKELQKTAGADKKLSMGLSCCAGVAIVSAKYPFFRAYELAEQLCDAAKKNSRQDDTSWLDFAILHGEKTPELDQLRRQQYVGAEGYLHYGPYKVGVDYTGDDGLNALLRLEGLLSSRSSYTDWLKKGLTLMEARNKIKKLREVLTGNQHAINIFFENTTDLQQIMKEETHKENVTAEDFWTEAKKEIDGKKLPITRYIDAIELMDFRPEEKER